PHLSCIFFLALTIISKNIRGRPAKHKIVLVMGSVTESPFRRSPDMLELTLSQFSTANYVLPFSDHFLHWPGKYQVKRKSLWFRGCM
uniref:Maturase K n=1 Tax=Chelonoidis abingdonii TaxID=106734 RepID=A0A8C0GS61_CHEAB